MTNKQVQQLLKHYSYFDYHKEIACPCCGECHIQLTPLLKLIVSREYLDLPMPINSGYRCENHNKEVGSTSDNHTKGYAFDIACISPQKRYFMVDALIHAGFKRIIIYPTFVHVDNHPDKHSGLWIQE